MNRISVAGLLFMAASTPGFAASNFPYAGLQMDNISAGALLGYQIDKVYAVEAHYTKSDSHIAHSGITSDTNISAFGVAALAMLPMKLYGGMPYFLFGKAGYERINKEETYSIPSSVTLTLPYNDKVSNFENRVILGGGVQYDFYQNLNGRVGIDFTGDKRSVYLGVIFRY
jgi:hypothetical protein